MWSVHVVSVGTDAHTRVHMCNAQKWCARVVEQSEHVIEGSKSVGVCH